MVKWMTNHSAWQYSRAFLGDRFINPYLRMLFFKLHTKEETDGKDEYKDTIEKCHYLFLL